MNKFYYFKKSQSAVEFLLILTFVLTIIAAIMFISGSYLIDIKNKEIENTAKNFVDNINNEITILNNVESGYSREMPINVKKYGINITKNVIILKDLENNNKTYYFNLLGNFDIRTIEKLNEHGYNTTFIVFEKQKNLDNSKNIYLEPSSFYNISS